MLDPSEYAAAHIDDPKIFFARSLEAAAQENVPMIQADTWTADQRDRTLTQHMMRYWKLNIDAKGSVSSPASLHLELES